MDDTISRLTVLDAIDEISREVDDGDGFDYAKWREYFCELPPVKLATDTNVGNSSEMPNSSDCISRQAAIEVLRNRWLKTRNYEGIGEDIAEECEIYLKTLPSAQPEIIRCRDCKFASGDSRICMKFGHSPIGELDFCAWAERRTDE